MPYGFTSQTLSEGIIGKDIFHFRQYACYKE